MLYNLMHNRVIRFSLALAAIAASAVPVALFMVPQGLYSGGIMGMAQLIRTLLLDPLGVSIGGYDIAGIVYFLLNVPIILVAWKMLGRGFVIRTLLCVAVYSLVYSVVPIPEEPLVDPLTSCLIGGVISGVAAGMALTFGGNSGGLDVVGLCLNKAGVRWSIGRFSIGFNAVIYGTCAILFNPIIAIYSIIYHAFLAIVMDRFHKQNVDVKVTIISEDKIHEIADYITHTIRRGATFWPAMGAYTQKEHDVMVVCLSKYEVEELQHQIHVIDPHAFLIVQEGIRISGNYLKKVE